MKRREFLEKGTAALGLGGLIIPSWPYHYFNHRTSLPRFTVRRLTSGPANHFFGYYGMSPWNASESKMACLSTTFQDRLPKEGEKAQIGLVDPISGAFSKVSETKAWNLQQGALLHWNPIAADREIVYNDQTAGGLNAVVFNLETRQKRLLSRPISAVATTGRFALSLNYGRLSRLRKTVGYTGATDPFADQAHPSEDGIFRLDLETGESKLIVSIKEVFVKAAEQYPVLAKRHMWFNHTVLNPEANRLLFLARTRDENNHLDSAMFTVNIDGTELHQVIPFNSGVSHFAWRNNFEIAATFRLRGQTERQHIIFTDRIEDYRVIGENFLLGDGHCTFSPNGKWLATDRKDSATLSQSLWWWDYKNKAGMILCHFPMMNKIYLKGHTRCDFHPRWNPSGNKICFDAIDPATWTRQLHLVEFLDL